ncbi:hypothetical protein A9404_05840 [Halothiobacillus diazotrophicus]|uniref:Uncharacterized protein n=1 Tax=Halothiobacillus diazotrophicus TaxID=1860122 RepID=A0A191ZGI1_9GAMM|nr:hypothetical protein [Halothiobacillus diazotrophicus]ANJ66962.1 hypothetical protein A9404_05840 [Halothiobacillus diazotrophicus]
MSNDDDLNELDEHWEEEDNDDNVGDAIAPNATDKTKPADSKDSRRRLEALLEQQRIKREIDDIF